MNIFTTQKISTMSLEELEQQIEKYKRLKGLSDEEFNSIRYDIRVIPIYIFDMCCRIQMLKGAGGRGK